MRLGVPDTFWEMLGASSTVHDAQHQLEILRKSKVHVQTPMDTCRIRISGI